MAPGRIGKIDEHASRAFEKYIIWNEFSASCCRWSFGWRLQYAAAGIEVTDTVLDFYRHFFVQ